MKSLQVESLHNVSTPSLHGLTDRVMPWQPADPSGLLDTPTVNRPLGSELSTLQPNLNEPLGRDQRTEVIAPRSSRTTGVQNTAEGIRRIDGRPTGRNLARVMDIGRGAAAATVTDPNLPAEQRTFFRTRAQLAAQETSRLRAEYVRESNLQPPDPERLEDLQKLIDLSRSLEDLYLGLSGANVRGDGVGNAASVLDRIAVVETALAEAAALVGPRNHREMQLHLLSLTDMMTAYPELRDPPGVDQIDVFVMTTYKRLEQIEGGQRTREHASVQGALQTYRNDRKDLNYFDTRFRYLRDELTRGNYDQRGLEAYRADMLYVVRNTDNAMFKTSVARLAEAHWQSYQAERRIDRADDNVRAAAEYARSAFDKLEQAGHDLTEVEKLIGRSVGQLQDGDAFTADETYDVALKLHRQAEGLLRSYGALVQMSTEKSFAAETYLNQARDYLIASNAALELIKAHGHPSLINTAEHQISKNDRMLYQVNDIRRQNGIVREDIASREESYKAHLDWSAGLKKNLSTLENHIQLRFVEIEVNAHIGEGANCAHDAVASILSEADLSPKARAFLLDPASLRPADAADIREEFVRAFDENPQLAVDVVNTILASKPAFDKERARLMKRPEANADAIRMLDAMEHGYLEAWLGKDAVVVEALLSSADLQRSAETQGPISSLRSWLSAARGRYSKHILSDSGRAKEQAQRFHDWMVTQPRMQARWDSMRTESGPPEMVPMTLHVSNTGALVNFNAYVAKVDGEWWAYNPLDGRTYKADSRAAALERLAKDSQVGDGVLRYFDGGELHEATSTSPPEGTVWVDIGMGVLGLVGGVAMLIPEPFTTVGGGAAVATSSGYFIAKGSIGLYDVIEHETFGNNAQTWGAVLDIASGALMFLRGAGAVSATVKGESMLAARLSRMANSTYLNALDGAATVGDFGLAAHGMVQIYNDNSLSDEQKIKQGGLMLMAIGLPVAAVKTLGVVNRKGARASRAEVENALQNLRDAEQLATQVARETNPHSRAQLASSLDDLIARAQTALDSRAFDAHGDLRPQVVALTNSLRALRANLPSGPQPGPTTGATTPAGLNTKSHSVDADAGLRRTVGWSGEPTNTPSPAETHLPYVQRGQWAVNAGTQSRLNRLLTDAYEGRPSHRKELAKLKTELGALGDKYNAIGKENLDRPEYARQEQNKVAYEMNRVQGEIDRVETRMLSDQRLDLEAAQLLMSQFRTNLLNRASPTEIAQANARADAITIDPSVPNPAQVRQTIVDFIVMTGYQPPPLTVYGGANRGLASLDDGSIQVANGSPATVMHELAHFWEQSDPNLATAAAQWRDARGLAAFQQLRTTPLAELTGQGYANNEVAIEDHFSDPYVGRAYDDGRTEVISTGMEHFASADAMLKLYMQDPEHFFMVLGAFDDWRPQRQVDATTTTRDVFLPTVDRILPAADVSRYQDVMAQDANAMSQSDAEWLYAFRVKSGLDDADAIPGTPEHKAHRWQRYKDGKYDGTDRARVYWSWSKTYQQNMIQAAEAHKVADAYHATLGWGRREVTVYPGGEARRLDIADVKAKKAYELKAGYTTMNDDIRSEIARDKILVEEGWEITWRLEGRASKELRAQLDKAGIKRIETQPDRPVKDF